MAKPNYRTLKLYQRKYLESVGITKENYNDKDYDEKLIKQYISEANSEKLKNIKEEISAEQKAQEKGDAKMVEEAKTEEVTKDDETSKKLKRVEKLKENKEFVEWLTKIPDNFAIADDASNLDKAEEYYKTFKDIQSKKDANQAGGEEKTEEAGFSKSEEKKKEKVIFSVAELCGENEELQKFFKDNGYGLKAGVTKETFEKMQKEFEEKNKGPEKDIEGEMDFGGDAGNQNEDWRDVVKRNHEELDAAAKEDDKLKPAFAKKDDGTLEVVFEGKDDKENYAIYSNEGKHVKTKGEDATRRTIEEAFEKRGLKTLNLKAENSDEYNAFAIRVAKELGMSVTIDGKSLEEHQKEQEKEEKDSETPVEEKTSEEESKTDKVEDAEVVEETENSEEKETALQKRIEAAKKTIELRKKAFDGDKSYAEAREVIKEAAKDGAKFKLKEGKDGFKFYEVTDEKYKDDEKLNQSLAEWAKYRSIKDITK